MTAAMLSATELSAGQECWKTHRNWSLQVPFMRSRAWAGLACVVERDTSGLVPNEGVEWVTLVDIPPGHMRLRKKRAVYWLSARRAQQWYGMPFLGGYRDRHYDFRSFPGSGAECGPDSLDGLTQPRLFLLATTLNIAMSAAAVNFSDSWRDYRTAFVRDVLEINSNGEDTAEAATARLVPLGDDVVLKGTMPAPRSFLPRPYLGFSVPLASLFAAVLRPFKKPTRCDTYCPPALVGRFLDDYGDMHNCQVAGLPPRWRNMPLRERWGAVQGRLGFDFLPRLEAWFECNARTVGAVKYLPADLVAPAARQLALPGSLHWDFSICGEYWQRRTDAFVLPPVCLHARQLHGVWPGELAYDLTPRDRRYVGPCP